MIGRTHYLYPTAPVQPCAGCGLWRAPSGRTRVSVVYHVVYMSLPGSLPWSLPKKCLLPYCVAQRVGAHPGGGRWLEKSSAPRGSDRSLMCGGFRRDLNEVICAGTSPGSVLSAIGTEATAESDGDRPNLYLRMTDLFHTWDARSRPRRLFDQLSGSVIFGDFFHNHPHPPSKCSASSPPRLPST